MKRYIKVKHRWIDTLEEQKQGNIYFVIDERVYVFSETETYIGQFKAETDEKSETV